MSKVDIITLNFNNLEYTKMMVSTLFRNTKYPFHLIVVDNASKEAGTKKYLKTLESKATVHYNLVPDSGFAEGNNIGLQYAENDYILLMNNDILIPSKGWLNKLMSHFEDSNVALVGCKLLYPNDTIQFAGGNLMLNAFSTYNCFYHRGRFENKDKFSTTEAVPQLTFAFVLANKELFGKLDTTYKIGTFEDNDKCMEILEKGYKIIYDGSVYLYHYESVTQFKRNQEVFNRQMFINSQIFRKRWMIKIWRSLLEKPEFWGWSSEQLKQEIMRIEREGFLWCKDLNTDQDIRLTSAQLKTLVNKL